MSFDQPASSSPWIAGRSRIPDGVRNQIEGGILQGMSRALVEEVTWDNRHITSTDWETYNSLRLDYEMPAIESVFVTPNGVPAIGAGETAITMTPAAIGNAIFDATGGRMRDLPFTPERVSAALRAARNSSGRILICETPPTLSSPSHYCIRDAAAQTERAQSAGNSNRAQEVGAAAFEAIVPVLRHPRCMNCHSAGDFPRQGDDRHQHTMQVRRGPEGQGVNSVKCSACHQDHNLVGAPHAARSTGLAPSITPETPMIWEGLTDGQLCELFKDRRRTGIAVFNRSWNTCRRHWFCGAGIPARAAPQCR